MDETTILLVPAPGSKAEFLVTVEPLGPSDGSNTGTGGGGDLPFEVTLDGYTRDPWAVSSPPSDEPWRGVWLRSVDGRGKLPGFLKYLRERRKVPFGRFEPTSAAAEDGAAAAASSRGVLTVPFEQPVCPEELLGDGSDDVVFCRYILDERRIGRGYRSPQQQRQRQQQQQQQQQRRRAPPPKNAPAGGAGANAAAPKPKLQPSAAKSSRPSSGMLGNLLGASRRTNERLDAVPQKRKTDGAATADSAAEGGESGGGGAAAAVAKFRRDVEQKMLDFRSDAVQTCLKVPVSIADVTRDLPPGQRGSVTMDVLKYVVYEQAEEVGEDRWVAAREPSEFLDEYTVAVYKEGCAPEEVLEDLNKGELPDEIVQQQRAMRGAMLKELARKEGKQDALMERQTVGQGGPDMDFTTLNTEKRDRRTIEEIQRDMLAGGGGGPVSNKRQRTD